MLNSFLIFYVVKGPWYEVVKDSLWLVDHILKEMLFLVDLEEVHVGHLLDSVEVKVAFFELVFLGQKQLQDDEETDDGVTVKLKTFIIIISVGIWGSQCFHH